MYKCKECGSEFKNKPQYCDCGNDSFEEIITEKKHDVSEVQIQADTQESVIKRNLPSVIFLVFCIILSLIILFFIANPKDEPIKQDEKKQEINKQLPDIDKLWNDKKPAPTVYKPVVEQKKEDDNKIIPVEKKPVVQKIKPVISTQTKQQEKPKQNNQVQQQKPTAKTTTKKATTQPASQKQPVQSVVQKQPAQSVVQKQQTKQTTSQTQQMQNKQPAQTTQQNQTIKPQEVKQNTVQNIQTTPSVQINPEELKQYKKALRNKIASNIDFLTVAGDGKCVLSFNVSSGGNLLNRKFVSQSQNTSLNDAVYAAMLNVASFKTPPAGYKNETMKLTVQISGGNFSVSLE